MNIYKLADDGSIIFGEDNDTEKTSLTEEEQNASVEAFVERLAFDNIEIKRKAEKAEQSHLAAKSVVYDSYEAIKRSNVPAHSKLNVQKKMESALDSHKKMIAFINAAVTRANTAEDTLSTLLDKTKATIKQAALESIDKLKNEARTALDKFIPYSREQEELKKKYAYLFDYQDEVETNTKDYGETDFETDVKPEYDEQAVSTVEETKEDRDKGWRSKEPGIDLPGGWESSKKRNKKQSAEENLRSDEAEIPTPTEGDKVDTNDAVSESYDDIEDIMADALQKRRKKSVYNDTEEYTAPGLGLTDEIEDQAGDAGDIGRDEESEPGKVDASIWKKVKRMAEGEDMDLEEEEIETEAQFTSEDEDDDIEAKVLVPGDEEETKAFAICKAIIRSTKKHQDTKKHQGTRSHKMSIWKKVKKMAEGEDVDFESQDEDMDLTSEDEDMDYESQFTSQDEDIDLTGQDEDMDLDLESQEDEVMDLDDMEAQFTSEDEDMDFESQDEDIEEDITSEDEDMENFEGKYANKLKKQITHKAKLYNNKFKNAMNLVNMERFKGLRSSPLQDALATVIAKDLSISDKKAKQIIRKAMILGFQKDSEELIKEASRLISEYKDDKQFITYYNRISSMRIADEDEIFDEEAPSYSDDSEAFTEPLEDEAEMKKESRKANQKMEESFKQGNLYEVVNY